MRQIRSGMKALSLLLAILIAIPYAAEAQAPPAAPVMVEKVETQTVQKPVVLVGAVEPVKRSTVASEIAGLVQSFPAQEGDYVEQGQELAKFSTRQSEISLNEARANKREASARYNLSRQDLERFSQLQDKGVASVSQYQGAEAEKNAWAARISQSQAQIDSFEYDIEKSTIRAPFSGYVTAEYTEQGQWIEEGGPVVEMIATDMMEIKVDMPERYIHSIKKGSELVVSFDSLPGTELKGEIVSIVPQADSETRTFPVRISIDNKNGLLKSGMVARASFPIGKPSTVMMVPKDAIVTQNNANFIYIVNEGSAQPLPVTTGIAYEDMIQIIGPVETGQLVVVKGNERLMPNQPVKVLNEQPPAKNNKVN